MEAIMRIERDSMGEMKVPSDAYYGAQTARAVENFPISNLKLSPRFIRSLAMIKQSAARTSHSLKLLDADRLQYIEHAAQEIIDGKHDNQFVIDVFQTGSGTSTNMNVNEVIASRANEIATGKRGGNQPVHPNDHVNLQQSSNDTIPTAMHIAAAVTMKESLSPSLEQLELALFEKSKEFDDVIKIGRTHLQDATPIRLGQEFSGYAQQAHLSVMRTHKAINALRELPLGGTAVGTGINSHPDFAKLVIADLAKQTGIDFVEAKNHFEAQSAKDSIIEASGQLRTIALSLGKIANDIRFLASGPRCGIGEISLPATQPGSSIMPGKVNPVMCEMVLQVAAKVIGNDATIAFAASPVGSTFELNVMMPVMAHALLESIELLSRATNVFTDRCIRGIEANRDRCAELVEQSLALATPLVPIIGYDAAADIAKESVKTGKTVRIIATERKVLDEKALDDALDVRKMTEPSPNLTGKSD